MPAALTLAAVVVWIAALPRVDLTHVSDLGLVSALGPLFFVAGMLLAAGFVAALVSPSPRPWLLAVQVAVLVLVLHGTAGLVEPEPRFSAAWTHAGFVDYIARTGRTLPNLDARFSWPGFFSVAALVTRAAGFRSPVSLLRWAPLVFNLLYLFPLLTIVRTVTSNQRVQFLALWLFAIGNWVGQDYFSPQALNYFLALAFLAVVLRWFRAVPSAPARLAPPDRARWRDRLRSRLLVGLPEEVTPGPPPLLWRGRLVVVLIVLFAVIVISHQMTPVILLIMLAVLTVTQRSSLRSLPVTMAVLFAGWVSYATVAYWSGHLDSILGGIGHLGSSVHENVSEHVTGTGGRLFVLHVRMGLTVGLGLLAAIGFVRRLRSGYGDLTVGLLAASPFAVLMFLSYDGEGLMRAYLFALPFLAILAAFAFRAHPERGFSRVAAVAVAGLSTLLLPVFMIAGYGNEQFEMVRPGERKAVEWVTEAAPAGARFVFLRNENIVEYHSIELHDHISVPLGDDGAVAGLDDVLSESDRPTYLITTRGVEFYGESVLGFPTGWTGELVRHLVGTGRYQVVFANRDATVLTRIGERSGA